jgi:hypothetical protein
MRIAVLGGGPAGLYFASLWKGRHPESEVRLFEQNPGDVTWGFGVVFSERALEFLREDDEPTYALITPKMEAWRDITLVHRGERIRIDGVGFSAIGRLTLLQILQERARAVGVHDGVRSRRPQSVDELAGFDVVVAADGVNSLVRRSFEGDFGTSIAQLDNKFAWYGTTKRFDSLTLTFVSTPEGTFTAHHYRYSPEMSTFIVECDRATWERAGFDAMTPEDAKAYCERAFARHARRAPARLEQHLLADVPAGVEPALGVPEHGPRRRRTPHRALLDRIGDPPRDGGRRRAREGARGRSRGTCARGSRATRRSGGRSSTSSSPPPTRARHGTSRERLEHLGRDHLGELARRARPPLRAVASAGAPVYARSSPIAREGRLSRADAVGEAHVDRREARALVARAPRRRGRATSRSDRRGSCRA